MFFKYNKWAMLWALIILILCGMPGRDIPHISFLELLSFDKFVHAGIFFILALLTIRGFYLQSASEFLHLHSKTSATCICSVYGGLLEIMQGTLCEGRTADVYDFIADSFGAIIGCIMYDYFEKKVLIRIIK